MHLLAAPDKFHGTISAAGAATVICDAAIAAGWTATAQPVSDGGEGLLDCLGGANRFAEVTGPLGEPVRAGWRVDGDRAVIEMAQASGLSLVFGRADPMAATTTGTGELISAAISDGARTVIVGVGGSATTDGGLGALTVLENGVLDDTDVVVAADVRATFVDAARLFAPQKGANADQVLALEERLDRLADVYLDRFGVDVRTMPGSGAAGGLAGGLAALGAHIRPGFDVVAELLDLPAAVSRADLVVTGEGRLDDTSLLGKATIGVARLAVDAEVRCVILAGEVAADIDGAGLPAGSEAVSLTERFGAGAARTATAECLRAATREILSGA
ncbi:MAG TPA: glycerate kinase [Jatrophihabitantaceae bacterium]|nr:glycerate kinase [Jatrophihabitantaceae bacterium]